MPTTIILDKAGIVKFMHKGYHDGEEVEIEKEIKSLL
jgi:predicted transcriptional regulator